MGLFDELDVAGAADDPFNVPDNTYEAVVSDLQVKKDKNGNMAMTFFYTIKGGEQNGLRVSEYKRLPHSTDSVPLAKAEADRATSFIKQRLASLGVPEARMNSIEKDDLIGIDCYVTTKKNGDYVNIRDVSLTANDVASGATEVASNPFG